jgi:hypothetical protein
MKTKSIINWFSFFTLTALGAVLGGEYKNPVHLVALLGILGYASVTQLLISQNNELESDLKNTKSELDDANLKVSQILFQTNLYGENRLYLAVHPVGGGTLRESVPFSLQIVMNAPFSVQPPPDIKLYTKKSWGTLGVGPRHVFPESYGSEWEYRIPISLFSNLENTSDKFFSALINIEITNAGNYEYSLEAKSRDFLSRVSGSLDIMV